MKTRSIAFKLIAAVLAVELASAILVVLLAFGYERHAHFRSFDVMLRGRADSVLAAVQDAEDVGDNVMLDLRDVQVPNDDVYEVWDGRGHMLGRSDNWLGSRGFTAPERDGLTPLHLNGRDYRLLRLHGSRIVDPGDPSGGKFRPVTILYGAPTGPLWHGIEQAMTFYIVGSLVLLAVSGPLIAWMLHLGLMPLRQLAALAGKVSADAWEFDPPTSARSTPELAPLTQALENVLTRLERAFTQQRTFVSDAAHELKTAVAVVKSSLQLLELKERTPAEYQAGLERCLADAERLEALVAKMLMLARVESGAQTATATLAHCAMTACVRNTVDRLSSVATLRGIVVSMSACDDCAVPISSDDCALLVENLLMNAIEHSPRGSSVALRVSCDAGSVLLEVEDHGEGVGPEALPHVFERFSRGDSSRARSTGGTGLGLAICKAVVERAGGTIEMKSVLGAGTTVLAKIPQSSG